MSAKQLAQVVGNKVEIDGPAGRGANGPGAPALKRLNAGETTREIARSYNASHSTISRLR